MPIQQMMLGAGSSKVTGQVAFTTDGTETSDRHHWVCPDGVTSISIVCIGAGGYGSYAQNNGGDGGGGGALAYKNNYTVVPGTTYHIYCGKANTTTHVDKHSWFSPATTTSNTATVNGLSGTALALGGSCGARTAGWFQGDGGGVGGAGGEATGGGTNGKKGGGGGGAGGYGSVGHSTDGKGGDGGDAGDAWPDYENGSAGAANSGAAGGGGGVGYYSNSGQNGYGGGGGGVGLLGRGSTGAGGAGDGAVMNPSSGITASRGGNGSGGTSPNSDGEYGGYYGGGSGGPTSGNSTTEAKPGRGAVRLIWPGDERQFPSTRTADE